MFIFPVDPQFQGTCALKQAGSTQRCVDYMDNGAQLPGNGSALQPMEGEAHGQGGRGVYRSRCHPPEHAATESLQHRWPRLISAHISATSAVLRPRIAAKPTASLCINPPSPDASMAEACGFIPVSQVLPTLYSW